MWHSEVNFRMDNRLLMKQNTKSISEWAQEISNSVDVLLMAQWSSCMSSAGIATCFSYTAGNCLT